MRSKRGLKTRIVVTLLCALTLCTCTGCQEKAVLGETPPISSREFTQSRAEAAAIKAEEAQEALLKQYLERLTLEEKVAQLFVVQPEALAGAGQETAAGQAMQDSFNEKPVGGFIYMGQNLVSAEQVKEALGNISRYSLERLSLPPFLCIDEEGGTVARIGGTGKFDVPKIGNMSDIGKTLDPQNAYAAGLTMGAYLSELGFNVDFAPVADVRSNPQNTIVKKRAFGDDPQLVSQMAAALSRGLEEQGVYGTFKHFPGHGATAGDTHEGYAYTQRTLEELEALELVPFQEGIAEGAAFIMVGHISLPNVTGDDTPASLSHVMISQLLRQRMGYEGIAITDAMDMGAITEHYAPSEAAVEAIRAGADIILMPEDFDAAYQGVLDAVSDGRITVGRIDESVSRILRVKLQMAGEQPE